MPAVVGVAFRPSGKTYSFDPDGLDLRDGDQVIVKTTKGIELGEVVGAIHDVDTNRLGQPLKKIIRKAGEDDLSKLERNREKEAEAFTEGQKRIAEHKLPMHLVMAEQMFDGSKLTFYFTADSRVDFRELVRDLAGHFKTRIELRQIGVRDKARMVGGLGHCGQHLCCATFLSDFNPVSIRMAKEQDLPLNPVKISGVCGRLMCCLQYEFEAYKDFKKRAPRRGACVETCAGHKGCVVEQYAVKERLKIEDENGKFSEIDLADVKRVLTQRPPGRQEADDEIPEEVKALAEEDIEDVAPAGDEER